MHESNPVTDGTFLTVLACMPFSAVDEAARVGRGESTTEGRADAGPGLAANEGNTMMNTGRPQSENVAALKRQWEADAPNERGVRLQDEFAGDFEAFVAYTRHNAAGDVTILGVERPKQGTPKPTKRAPSEESLRRTWEADAPNERGVRLQDEFAGDFEAFSAWATAEAAGSYVHRGTKAKPAA